MSRDPAPASHWPGWCWPRSSTSWPRCPAPTPGTSAACRRAASRTGPRVATTRCCYEGDLLPTTPAPPPQGHSFWDTATWMYPPILLLHPAWARLLITYRWRRLQAAKVPSSFHLRIYLMLHQPAGLRQLHRLGGGEISVGERQVGDRSAGKYLSGRKIS